jgi:hypothetical protein
MMSDLLAMAPCLCTGWCIKMLGKLKYGYFIALSCSIASQVNMWQQAQSDASVAALLAVVCLPYREERVVLP